MDLNGLRDFHQTLVVRGIAQSTQTAAKTVVVKFAGTAVTCRVLRGVPALVAGDVVLAMRSGNELIVLEALHAAAPTADPIDPASSFPPNPWASVQTGSTTLRPVETRSYRDTKGWRKDTDDLFQGKWSGERHKGCAFYGKGPRALSGAEVLSAQVKVKRMKGTSGSTVHEPTTLRRFEEKTRPKTADVTLLSGTTDGPRLSQGESENYTIPVSWGQELVDGTAGGLAIYKNSDDPKAQLAGRSHWTPAWTLLLTWRRVI